MASVRNWVLLALLAASAWWLYPWRSDRSSNRQNVIELHYMGPGGPISGAMDDVIRAFERESQEAHARDATHPVYRVISGQNAARDQVADPTRFLVSVAGGAPPDVILFDRFAVAEWAARGAFQPLDRYLLQDQQNGLEAPRAEKFYPSCWNEAVYQGQVYGIPSNASNRAMFYNKDLFTRAGLVDGQGQAKPPQNWDELRQYALRLTERDNNGNLKCIGFAPLFGNSWLYLYGWMNGGEFMSSDGNRCTLNDAHVVNALQFMRDLYDQLGGYPRVSAFEAGFQGHNLDAFIQGKVAIKIDTMSAMLSLANFGRSCNFAVAPPPMPAAADRGNTVPVTWVGGSAYAIPATARHKQAAWELIRFLSSEKAQWILMESGRAIAEAQGQFYIPPQLPQIEMNQRAFTKYVYDNPNLPERYKAGCRVFNDLLPSARFRPVTPVGQLLWNEQQTATQAALYHKVTPQQALDRGTAAVQRSLDQFLHPAEGTPIRSWNFFFWGYAILLLIVGIIVFARETKVGLRRKVQRVFGRRVAFAEPTALSTGERRLGRDWGGGILCALPWIIGFIVFGGGPMLFSLLISFCEYDVLNPPRFIGLHNYRWMFGEDRLFVVSLWNTIYMAVGVPLGMIAGLTIAMLLNQNVKWISLWRTFFYLPAIVPMVAASVLWVWIFNPQGGPLSGIFSWFGADAPLWLQSPTWSKPSLILMSLWTAGSSMIIWLAGLKGIPRSLYEAATVDGAGNWAQFRYVTLPQLTPYIFFNSIMGLIHTFQLFGQAFIMTQGGPVNSTLFYVYHLFNNAFRYGRMGYACAMAWVLLAIVLVLTAIQFRLSRRWVHYDTV